MNADYELINNIKKSIPSFDTYIQNVWVDGIEYPLDQEESKHLKKKMVMKLVMDNLKW